jgi:GrpB-like predicted nucleotidyltransferase (UPF0157 family)
MLVVPHDPAWANRYTAEAERIAQALGGDALRALHHIGSTAIPGICAKPIIDMLAEVRDLDTFDTAAPALAALGYQVMGEFGIAGRRYFRKDDHAGTRTHHLHAFAHGSPHIARHLAFRDYLRAHPGKAQAYGALKLRLAAEPDHYVARKGPFVVATEAEALAWWERCAGY